MTMGAVLTAPRRLVLRVLIAALLLALPVAAAGPAAPARAADVFAPFMSEADEKRIGAEEHAKVLAEFGGAYKDAALQRYVTSLGTLLKSTTERAREEFTFTLLDSNVVNAFALPGGYVYVTRGLMALANDEAELAGVIGHEIGHVVARHPAQRYSQGVIAGLGAAILGAVTKSDVLSDVAQLGAAAYVQGFSRDQEFEADQFGIAYMTKAGFDPAAMSTFLASLESESRLAATKAGKEGGEPELSLFSSHPRTADRVAIAARTAAANADGPIARDRELYLKKIDGLVYGDSPSQGFVRGRKFMHPELRLYFEAPPGFTLGNSQSAVLGRSKQGDAVLRFDADGAARGVRSMSQYLNRNWAPSLNLRSVEDFTVNGLEAATGSTVLNTREGSREVRLVAIRGERNQIYRFMLIGAPEISRPLDEAFRDTVFSFRRLSNAEAAKLKPLRLKVHTVKRGDTPETLARRMAVEDFQLDTFLTLNGEKGARLSPGSKVKLIVAGR
jgi:predicted Zn-dependent protease